MITKFGGAEGAIIECAMIPLLYCSSCIYLVWLTLCKQFVFDGDDMRVVDSDIANTSEWMNATRSWVYPLSSFCNFVDPKLISEGIIPDTLFNDWHKLCACVNIFVRMRFCIASTFCFFLFSSQLGKRLRPFWLKLAYSQSCFLAFPAPTHPWKLQGWCIAHPFLYSNFLIDIS